MEQKHQNLHFYCFSELINTSKLINNWEMQLKKTRKKIRKRINLLLKQMSLCCRNSCSEQIAFSQFKKRHSLIINFLSVNMIIKLWLFTFYFSYITFQISYKFRLPQLWKLIRDKMKLLYQSSTTAAEDLFNLELTNNRRVSTDLLVASSQDNVRWPDISCDPIRGFTCESSQRALCLINESKVMSSWWSGYQRSQCSGKLHSAWSFQFLDLW